MNEPSDPEDPTAVPPPEDDFFGGKTLDISTGASDGLLVEPPDTPPLKSFGDYDLIEEIARGGMGVVYKARQRSLNRTVAVKMILAGELADEEHVQRFYTEAEAAAALRHPNIVSIFEVGQQDGQHFFSMEYVEGRSLAALIKSDGMNPEDAAAIVFSVAEAIHYAHEQGVIHRDLKPENVLMDEHDEPQVTDFGLAKLTESDSDLTRTGSIMGTPAFMSPEQAAAKGGSVGALSDVYSLGAVLFAALTGRAPFEGDNPLNVMLQVRDSEAPRPREYNHAVPRDLDTICFKCLAKDPEHRYDTAGELADDLDRYLEGEPIQASRLSLFGRIARWSRQKPILATAYFCATAFYLVHLFNMLVLKSETEAGSFHWLVTFVFVVVCMTVTWVQWLLDRERWHGSARILFYSVIISLFTLLLTLDQGAHGTRANLFYVIVVFTLMSGEGVGLTWFVVGGCSAAYTWLLIYAAVWQPANVIPMKDRIIYYVFLISIGLIVHLSMRRSRPVSMGSPQLQNRTIRRGGYRSPARRKRSSEKTDA